MRRTVAVGILLLAVTALADERGTISRMLDAAAERAIRAVRDRDADALRGIAAEVAIDPWMVAQVLCERGERSVALSLAAASEEPDPGPLARYVESLPPEPPGPDLREGLVVAEEHMLRGDRAATVATLDAMAPPRDPVRAVHRDLLRGQALRRMVRLRDSMEAFRRVGEAAERIGWARMAAGGLDEAGDSAFAHADYGDAKALYARSLAWSEKVGDPVFVAAAELDLGNALTRLGEHALATEVIERVRARYEALGDAAGVARALGNLANLRRSEGDREGSIETNFRSLRAFEGAGDAAGALVARANLALELSGLGRMREALDLAEPAVQAARGGGRPDLLGSLCETVARVYLDLGDPDRALEAADEALRAWRLAGDPRRMAGAHRALAAIHLRRDASAEATAHLEEAQRFMEASGDAEGMENLLVNRAALLKKAGDEEGSMEILGRALEIARGERNDAGCAHILHRMAGLLLPRDRGAAMRHLAEAIEAAERSGNLTEQIAALGNRALLLHMEGRSEEALATAKRAVSLADLAASGHTDELSAILRGHLSQPYEVGLHVAAALGDLEAGVFFVESRRAGSLRDALGGRAALDGAVVPADLRRLDAGARAREAAASEALRNAEREGRRDAVREARAALEEARNERRSVLDTLERRSKASAQLVATVPASLAALRAALDEGETLVLFAPAFGDLGAIVVESTEARFVPMGPEKDIAEACRALRAGDPDAPVETAVARLRELVVGPLGLGPAVKRLLVSPDGPLAYLPFSLLVEGPEVVHVPSGSAWLLLAPEAAKRGEKILALGDPDYRAAGQATRRRGPDRVPLPATRDEAKAIGTDLLLGKEATETGLRDALARRTRWRAVHLACHGRIDHAHPTLSALALTPTAEDDGMLTVLEVLASRIPADLVVLSACETARGKVVSGEGIVGLTRAFLYAGTPRVIVSLWPVDDDATAALMKAFYALWKAGTPPPRALREAQAEVRIDERWTHPAYWAAWTLWGSAD
jgi:tetratricopeptide (TPR) repeat protein